MPVQGHTVLLGVSDQGSPAQYTTIAGLRTKSLAFNGETVDVTNADHADKWRRLLAGAGILSASISAAGVFEDAGSDATLRTNFMNRVIDDYQFRIPGFFDFEGQFQIAALEYSVEHNAEVQFTITLESAGPIFASAI